MSKRDLCLEFSYGYPILYQPLAVQLSTRQYIKLDYDHISLICFSVLTFCSVSINVNIYENNTYQFGMLKYISVCVWKIWQDFRREEAIHNSAKRDYAYGWQTHLLLPWYIKRASIGLSVTLRCQFNINSSLPGQNGRHFEDDVFIRISLNWKTRISSKISLKFVLKVLLTLFEHWFR